MGTYLIYDLVLFEDWLKGLFWQLGRTEVIVWIDSKGTDHIAQLSLPQPYSVWNLIIKMNSFGSWQDFSDRIKCKSWKYLRDHLLQLPYCTGEQTETLQEGHSFPPRSNAKLETQPSLNIQSPGTLSGKSLPDQTTFLRLRGPQKPREASICINP